MPNATYPQVVGKPFDLYFILFDADGSIITAPTDLASRVVVDGRAMVGPVPRLVAGGDGVCVATLTRSHTNGRVVMFIASCSNVDALKYTERIQTATTNLDTIGSRVLKRRRN